MEFNCLLFPRKKDVNIGTIESNVILIPIEEDQSHLYYLNLINPAIRIKDELRQRIDASHPIQQISLTQQMKRLHLVKKNISHYTNNIGAIESSFQIILKKNSVLSQSPPLQLRTLPISNKQQPSQFPSVSQQKPSVKVRGYIPCFFLPGKNNKFIIYFHGNAQDIKSCSQFLRYIHRYVQYSIIAMQYEGYSIYEGSPSADKIEKDIRILMNYLMRMGLSLDNIFIIGRSIGTGPALSLVSQYKTAGAMLVSPFLSICKLVKDRYGVIAAFLLKERYQNYKLIEFVDTPIFILHGLADNIIPHHHSVVLHELSLNTSEIKLIQSMTHMSFDFHFDFLVPLQEFLRKIRF